MGMIMDISRTDRAEEEALESGSAPRRGVSAPRRGVALRTEIAVIGAGQAGLSAAYHLGRKGLEPHRGFIIIDKGPGPGGAWQFRWPSLTLSTANRIHDLPGLRLSEVIDTSMTEVQASIAIPAYYDAYEKHFELPVYRPLTVRVVYDRGDRLIIETDELVVAARGVVNATGTWDQPYVPEIPGAERFRGRQLHTRDYRTAEEFAGQHVVIVGAGISAIQLLDEVSRVTTTTWVTRRPPDFREGPFDEEAGRAAVAIVEDRVRRGLPPQSVVSVTGLPVTPAVKDMRRRGVLERLPMFTGMTEKGIKWDDGGELEADVILWCTGFTSALDHLAPLGLREPNGGIIMAGRLATQVAKDPRIHLPGYGPSASTIGANRAGLAVATELMQHLGLG